MNLKAVLLQLIQFFSKEEIDFALIGAFALHAYGYVRATRDVDFLVRGKDQDKIVMFLEALGYETLYRPKGFSSHHHRIEWFGRIDFVYIEGETGETILSEARPLLILENLSIPVVRPEHLIALKVFAMKNDPQRAFREMADIQQFTSLPEIDRGEVREYFAKYGLLEKYDDLAAKEWKKSGSGNRSPFEPE